jgi:hypothetical protein
MNDFRTAVQQKTDDELLKMINDFDSWNNEMILAVEEELTKRNVSYENVTKRKQERIANEDAALQQGIDNTGFPIVIAWIFAAGLIGLLLGYHYAFSKTKSKYTDKVYYKYDEKTRKSGSNICYTAFAIIAIVLLYKIVTLY